MKTAKLLLNKSGGPGRYRTCDQSVNCVAIHLPTSISYFYHFHCGTFWVYNQRGI
jgi:hypothetical protein